MTVIGTKRTCRSRTAMSAIGVPAQPVDATQALNLSAGGFKLQGLTGSFVELTSHFVQMGCL
jgi:hypothetical protein